MTRPAFVTPRDRVDLTDQTQPGHDAVHNAFGLSYANYLVLQRSVMECMPNEWQLRFVALVNDLHALFDTSGNYRVELLDHDDHGEDEDTPERDRARVITDPLANYRHPDWAALAERRQLCGEGKCSTGTERHPSHPGGPCPETYPDCPHRAVRDETERD